MATKVTLSREAREFLRFPVSGLPEDAGALFIRFTPAGDWLPTDWEGTGTSRSAVILVAGDAADPGDAAAILGAGSYTPQARLIDNPEIVVRTVPMVLVVR